MCPKIQYFLVEAINEVIFILECPKLTCGEIKENYFVFLENS